MSRIDQLTLPLADGIPPWISYDSKTARPYVNGKPPRVKPRKRPLGQTARTMRDGAISQVTENEKLAWRELHDRELVAFLIEQDGAPFIAENFRQWFTERGNEPPHHPNVWGAMWMAATRGSKLVRTGRMLPPQDTHSHARLTTEWVKSHDVQEL